MLEIINQPEPHNLFPLTFSWQDKLSKPFNGELTCVANTPLHDANSWLNRQLSVRWSRAIGMNPFTGLVTHIRQSQAAYPTHTLIHFHLSANLYRLALAHHYRAFFNHSSLDVILSLTDECQLIDVMTSWLRQEYQRHAYEVQCQESSLAFLHRVMMEAGIGYLLQPTDQGQRLWLIDATTQLPRLGHILERSNQPMEGQRVAYHWRQTVSKHHQQVVATTNDAELQAGMILTDQMGHDWLVQQVQHDIVDPACRSHHGTGGYYRNCVWLTNDLSQWQAVSKPLQKAGLQSMIVSGNDHSQTPPQQNRIQCRAHWQQASDPRSSPWLEVGQVPMHHFVPRVGQEVVVMFMQGDPRQIKVLGSLVNATQTPACPLPQQALTVAVKSAPHPFNRAEPSHAFEVTDQSKAQHVLLRCARRWQQRVAGNWQQTTHGDVKIMMQQGDFIQVIQQGTQRLKAHRIQLQVGASKLQLDQHGLTLQSRQIVLGKAQRSPIVMGDQHRCPEAHANGYPHTGGPVLSGSSNVTINGKAFARVGDYIACEGAQDSAKRGSRCVSINGQQALHDGLTTEHGGTFIKDEVTSGIWLDR